jgi:hypothetical protein
VVVVGWVWLIPAGMVVAGLLLLGVSAVLATLERRRGR